MLRCESESGGPIRVDEMRCNAQWDRHLFHFERHLALLKRAGAEDVSSTTSRTTGLIQRESCNRDMVCYKWAQPRCGAQETGMESLLSKGGTRTVLVEEKDKLGQELNPQMTTRLRR